MHIQKKPKWNIFCRIKEDISDTSTQGLKLSFTTHDYINFVPPNGHVTNFNLHTELLSSNFQKLKAGVYRNSHACCLINIDHQGVYLHGASHDWQKLKELLAKILSSAGMEPKVIPLENTLHESMIEWTEAIFSLQK